MIAVSYLKSKYSKEETLKRIDNSIADYLHVDLMDGLYTKESNFDINETINDLKNITKPLDIHLMVLNPEKYIYDLSLLHPKRITFHLNTSNDIFSLIESIKEYNIEVGIAINPDEDIHLLDNYLNIIDYVLIMGVYPGMGGQEFIPDVLEKVSYLKNKKVLIGIDGGINDKVLHYLKNYQINTLVSGSFVCMSDDFNKQIELLKNIIEL